MDITPPFGYRNVQVLNRADYIRYTTSVELPPFVRDTAIVPVTLGEMATAAWHYPLVFVRDAAQQRVGLVAMLGLAQGENLFHTASGWKADAYQPAYVRRYPFCMAQVSVNGEVDTNLIVCVEKDFVAQPGDEGARQLFDTDGQPTAEWKVIETFLREYEADLERTRAFCARLLELDLLEPLTATITQPGKESWNVTGFLGINEKSLVGLPDETVLEWHRNGWLARAWLHRFSLQRMQQLLHDRGVQLTQDATGQDMETKDLFAV